MWCGLQLDVSDAIVITVIILIFKKNNIFFFFIKKKQYLFSFVLPVWPCSKHTVLLKFPKRSLHSGSQTITYGKKLLVVVTIVLSNHINVFFCLPNSLIKKLCNISFNKNSFLVAALSEINWSLALGSHPPNPLVSSKFVFQSPVTPMQSYRTEASLKTKQNKKLVKTKETKTKNKKLVKVLLKRIHTSPLSCVFVYLNVESSFCTSLYEQSSKLTSFVISFLY